MNRIDERFAMLKKENKKALITFLTIGDPDVEVSEQAIYTMQDEGVDLIELGVPFSDPAADGEIIQAADERAIARNTDIFKVFELVEKIRDNVKVPMVFLLYYNVMVQYGLEDFFKRCKQTGIDGLIIPDLPYEESEDIKEYTEQYGVYQIRLVTPTSKDRIKKIAQNSHGFLYCVSSLGVTGEKSAFSTDFAEFVGEIKKHSDIPACVGFGVSNGEQVKELTNYFDGAIVGSAIVKAIATGNSTEERLDNLRKKIRDLRTGL